MQVHSSRVDSTTGCQVNDSDYLEIRGLFDDYLRMYSTRDDLLTTHFSEDFSGITGSGDNLTKDREEWVAITRLDFAQVKDPIRIELKDLAIQKLADTIAVTTGFFTIHLPIEDHVLSQKTARLVLIFRKESSGWKISHSSISIPFGAAATGEVYPLQELEERNRYLEDLVKERTAQLHEANKLLEANAARREKIAARVPGVIYQFRRHADGSASIPYASAAMNEIFGVSPEEVVKDASLAFANIHREDIGNVVAGITEAAAALAPWQHEFRVTVPGRPDRWVLSNSLPELEEDGSTLWHGFITDITERIKAEKELQKKNEEIEQFIYTVSHDLRTPLVTIKTFMGFLEKDLASGDQKQFAQDVHYIQSAADKMKLLLDELLELTRIGCLNPQPVQVALGDIWADVISIDAGIIKESAAEISVPETGLILSGDRQRLCQVWQNLIENAVKYRVAETAPRIELGFRKVDGETVFFVKDNGIGINQQYHKKIFGIFEQLDPKNPGAGMGLALVNRIVEKYDGKIWVESAGVGSGSCFCFTLPAAMVTS